MKITTHEQGSPAWFDSKIGVLSGTRLSSILTGKGLTPSKGRIDMIYRLIDERLTGLWSEKMFSTPEMERGNDLEPLARLAYENETGIKIITTGLCLSDHNSLHGISPDGWTEGYKGAIEIKCHAVPHVKCIVENSIPDKHTVQLLNYFLVNEQLEWLDFVSYRPEFVLKPIWIKRITRESVEEQIKVASESVAVFFAEYEKIYTDLVF